MLFRNETLEGIRTGRITLAFRRWRRPSVRAGGTLLTAIGQLSIDQVERIVIDQISAADASRAGYGSKQALHDDLMQRTEGEIYRIELGVLRPDPRIALRQAPPVTELDFKNLQTRLSRLDQRAADGAWTFRTLEALEAHPAVRAADLCGGLGQEKERFKLNVRKLKTLGLSESLGTGYRLSPRGKSLLTFLRSEARRGAGGIAGASIPPVG
jgi:hypothetical protein